MAEGGGASRPRFRLLPTVLLTAAILALPTVVYGWGRSSSSFAIHKVVVTGTRLVPERRALHILRRDYLGHNLFTVTTHDVGASLSSLSYVSAARVDRDFPETLRVDIIEYRPAVYAYSGGHWYVIAADGRVICEQKQAAGGAAATTADQSQVAAAGSSSQTGRTAKLLATLLAGPSGATLRLPRIALNGQIAVGTTLSGRGVLAALPVVSGLPPALRDELDVVELAPTGLLTLRFSPGLVVIWGSPERSLAKALALMAVLKRYQTASLDCTFVDVSIPDRVLARPLFK
jgi:cell division septal protein FtsQ